MTQHTPGPWALAMGVPGQFLLMNYVPRDDQDESVHHANARLICAAPDLLAAAELGLKQAESWVENGDYASGPGHTYSDLMAELDPIRAAIAKARGEEVRS